MVLNIQLSIQGCQVEVPTTMANTIRTGNFRANQSEGEGIPKEMVKKLAKNKFKYTSVTHHLCHQFNNWYGILQVCFGEQALVAKEAQAWICHVDQHESSYNACFKADPHFAAQT